MQKRNKIEFKCLLLFFLVFAFLSCQTTNQVEVTGKKLEQGMKDVETQKGESAQKDPSIDEMPIQKIVKPKIGIILGPGGMKTFAHIGVLKQFHEKGLPIDYIVGIEWGSIIGSLYAKNGQVHELEWQISKLKESDIHKKTLFGSNEYPQSTSILKDFLDTVLANEQFTNFKTYFSCPTQSMYKKGILWIERGLASDQIPYCVAFPPIYRPIKNHFAAMVSPKSAGDHLRRVGAEIIVFVNLLNDDTLLNSDDTKNNIHSALTWSIVRSLYNSREQKIDFRIDVKTKRFDILDYNNKNYLIKMGANSARDVVEDIAQQYGF